MQESLFDQSFDESKFRKFISGLLIDFQEEKKPITAGKIFKKVRLLGRSDACQLAVITMQLDGNYSKKRFAVTQAAFQVLRQHRIRNALVAFYANNDTWRISLLTSTLEIKNGKIVNTTSNPKRYSYVLGPGAKTRTPRKFLIEQGVAASLDELKERFSVEVVNKHFYHAIVMQFIKLVGGERGEGRAHRIYAPQLKMPDGEEREAAEFALRTIGRIIFCWFLKEKRSAGGLSLMPNSLLSTAAVGRHPGYYHNVLEPIFFECLDTKFEQRKEMFRRAPFSQIPYLNGGLFHPQANDFYEQQKHIEVDDDWFIELFEVLGQYNFTVDENTNLDVDLSIDPEMLGRIFENLLAEINPVTGESARKATGSFYTPREIVEYMIDEALQRFLERETKVAREKIKNILDCDVAEKNKLHKEERAEIAAALKRLRVLDLACGSGAFPMGILRKVFYILQQVEPDGGKNFEKKLKIIQQSIFGVDIQPIATEIAKLRCFLALVIDEEIDDTKPNRGIQPLPNLEFKFVTANALKFLPENPNDPFNMFETGSSVELVNKVRTDFFTADEPGRVFLETEFGGAQNKIAETKQELAKARYESLAKWQPFMNKHTGWFDSEWMFGVKNFDIVIGNPPYGIELTHQEQEYYSKHYESAQSKDGLKGSLDTFGLFVERGLGMLKAGGILAYIVPMAITSNETMAALQNELEQKCETIHIASFTNRPKQIFDNACIRTSIIFCQKTNTSMKKLYMTKLIRRESGMSMREVINKIKFVEAQEYKMHGRYPKVGNSHETKILEKIFRAERHIKDYASDDTEERFYYRAAGGRYFNVVTLSPTGVSTEREYRARYAAFVATVLSTSLFWFYQQVYTDGLNLKGYEIEMFPVPAFEKVDAKILMKIEKKYRQFLTAIEQHVNVKNVTGDSRYKNRYFKEYKLVKSKALIDELDDLVDSLYGLTKAEIDYIKNYEVTIRMSGG